MKIQTHIFGWLLAALLVFTVSVGFKKQKKEESKLEGAWQMQAGSYQGILLLVNGYSSYTTYSQTEKLFKQTSGGPFTTGNSQLTITKEFDTEHKHEVGTTTAFKVSVSGNQLTLENNGSKSVWTRLDDGQQNLAGTWKITARKQDGTLTPIHQTGTRKTLKILSGTRFQWVAIDPGTKEFSGTGGGSYTFANGKYTEHIEFFSRDSSRVGASLSFDGKMEKDGWHHSGKSSKGEDIYEVWNKIQ